MGKAQFKWENINKVFPNPKNPRKDASSHSKEMMNIIKSKGWKEGITVYKKGQFYFILSGHRRWYAAKEAGMVEIPLYIVDAPKTEVEEVERIGSSQTGQVDWTPYEWAEYLHNMWIGLDKPPINFLIKKFDKSRNFITSSINVYKFYPKHEIEDKLTNKMFSVSMLETLRIWMRKGKNAHPNLFNELSISDGDYRTMMLKKLENDCLNYNMQPDTFVSISTDEQFLSFITDPTKKLSTVNIELSKKTNGIRVKNYSYNMNLLRNTNKELSAFSFKTKESANKLIQPLEDMQNEVKNKKEEMLLKMNQTITLV